MNLLTLPPRPLQLGLMGMALPMPVPLVVAGITEADRLDDHDTAIAELAGAYQDWSAAQALLAEAVARLNVAIAQERHTRAALAVEVR